MKVFTRDYRPQLNISSGIIHFPKVLTFDAFIIRKIRNNLCLENLSNIVVLFEFDTLMLKSLGKYYVYRFYLKFVPFKATVYQYHCQGMFFYEFILNKVNLKLVPE